MGNTDVIHIIVIDVIFARFIVLRITKKPGKAVFILPTYLCSILTVAIWYSTLSISRLFWMVALLSLVIYSVTNYWAYKHEVI